MQDQGETVLEVDGLSVRLDRGGAPLTLIEDVSLTIRAGECVALVGESGSGKSITSLAIMRLLQPRVMKASGRIMFRRRTGELVDLLTVPQPDMTSVRGAEIGMIFQEPMTSLNPLLPVGDQIAEMFIVHRGESRNLALQHAEEMLNRVGIPEAKTRLAAVPHELSGGMRQRVMIAMAIACDPALVIADEPTTALDVTIQAQILDMLRALQGRSSGMLFVSHDLGVIAEIADRIHVMYAGQVVESGRVADVLLRPRHPYTQGLVASVPRIDRPQPHGTDLFSIPGRVPDLARIPTGCRFHPRCAHAQPGRCDRLVPGLEQVADASEVRCFRWQEIWQADGQLSSHAGSAT